MEVQILNTHCNFSSDPSATTGGNFSGLAYLRNTNEPVLTGLFGEPREPITIEVIRESIISALFEVVLIGTDPAP
jgi:hypothetical protein